MHDWKAQDSFGGLSGLLEWTGMGAGGGHSFEQVSLVFLGCQFSQVQVVEKVDKSGFWGSLNTLYSLRRCQST